MEINSSSRTALIFFPLKPSLKPDGTKEKLQVLCVSLDTSAHAEHTHISASA